jgi:F0F1-type ATP synthase epsilon subunit
MLLNLRVVDKKGIVFEGETDFCEISTEAGIEGIMPKHVNFITNLAPGKIKYKNGEKLNEIDAAGGGFVEVSGGGINILLNS